MARDLARSIRVVDALVVIQQQTSTLIRVPDFDKLPPGQIPSWLVAAKLLSGTEVTGTYPEGHAIVVELNRDVAVPSGSLGVVVPFAVKVGDETIDLGQQEVWLDNPTQVGRQEADGLIRYSFTTPDRTARYRWTGASADD
jgi:hypothetical protein